MGDLGAILDEIERPQEPRTRRGAAVIARSGAPPRDFLQKVSAFKGLEITTMIRDVHEGLTTRRAALGAADLERPAGEHRRPLAGMFRVRVVPGNCCRDVLHDGIRSCSGTLGVSFGMQTILRGMRGANFNALRAILEPLGVHLGGVWGGLGRPLGGSGTSWALLGRS